MLKKIVLSAALLAGSLPAVAYAYSSPTPVAASRGGSSLLKPNGYEECLLIAGCFFDSGSMSWYCPDPQTYADCKVPDHNQ